MLTLCSSISSDRMTLNGWIYSWFVNSSKVGCCEIEGLPPEYNAYCVRDHTSYGVLIPVDGPDIEIMETFSNVTLSAVTALVELDESNYLKLSCELDGDNYNEKFSMLCADFIDPGFNGTKRKSIIKDPFIWWSEWKKLIGNKDSESKPYAVMGELLALCHMIDLGENPEWMGPIGGTIDVRGTSFDCEVKSTTVRSNHQITISSIFQMDNKGREQHLYRCCFEESKTGWNIDDVVEGLNRRGIDIQSIEKKLELLGLPRGSASRRMPRYILQSMLDYIVDEKFPRITLNSFKDDVLPKGVEDVHYTITLANVDNKAIQFKL